MADAGAALPLTREQIDEWSASYAGVRVGTDCPMGPLFAQARAALDLADEVATLKAEVERLRGMIDDAVALLDAESRRLDSLAEPDRG